MLDLRQAALCQLLANLLSGVWRMMRLDARVR
jgi:hypothetical protein